MIAEKLNSCRAGSPSAALPIYYKVVYSVYLPPLAVHLPLLTVHLPLLLSISPLLLSYPLPLMHTSCTSTCRLPLVFLLSLSSISMASLPLDELIMMTSAVQVDFEEVLQLVAKRKIYLSQGSAYLPISDLNSFILNKYRMYLREQLAVSSAVRHRYRVSGLNRQVNCSPVCRLSASTCPVWRRKTVSCGSSTL